MLFGGYDETIHVPLLQLLESLLALLAKDLPADKDEQVRSYILTKDSFINLDQDLLKVVKISGQVESTVQDKITQKWIQIFWLYFLPLKI